MRTLYLHTNATEMNTTKIRKELIEYISEADERFLKMVYAMSQEYDSDDIAGYATDGTPLTKEAVRKRVKAASRRVKSGQYLTQEDIEKEIANW